MRFTVLALLLISFAWGDDNSYKPGEGVQVGSFPLYIGGYFSLDYQQSKEQKQVRIDDFALLAYGDSEKFSYLAELEASDLYVKNWQPQNNHTTDTRFHAERLYLSYDFNDDNALRVGKFNSQIGFWNLTPINVLRDTTSSPISTEILFPKYTTGIHLEHNVYTLSEDTINLMLQQTRDVDAILNRDDVYNNFTIDRHYSLGWIHSEGEWKVQFNGGYFHTLELQNFYYMMASISYESESFKLFCEAGSQHDKNTFTIPYAGYVQGSYRLTHQHSLIARFEAYKDDTRKQKEAFGVFGYTYRPIYPVALKAEYQSHSNGYEDQFLCSFSVLF